MNNEKCKICRRAGQKLFLKESRCFSPKCAMIKKPYPPGKTTKKGRKQKSEYAIQLREKQMLKFTYGLREKQFSGYVRQALKKGGSSIPLKLTQLLETRLDNVLFRIGIIQSRSLARQIVGHGHISLNGRKVTVPSIHVKKGDKITIRKGSEGKKPFTDLVEKLKKYSPPAWIRLDKETFGGEIIRLPEVADAGLNANINAIIEFYSR